MVAGDHGLNYLVLSEIYHVELELSDVSGFVTTHHPKMVGRHAKGKMLKQNPVEHLAVMVRLIVFTVIVIFTISDSDTSVYNNWSKPNIWK